jgi:hypothetical protein
VGTGTKKDESSTGRVWAARFHHVTARSRLAGVLKLTNCLFLQFSVFLGRGEPRTLYQWVRGHDCTSGYGGTTVPVGTGERLYIVTFALF